MLQACLKAGDGEDVDMILKSCQAKGYATMVYANNLCEAAPQQRRTIFLIAVRMDLYPRFVEIHLHEELLRSWRTWNRRPVLGDWGVLYTCMYIKKENRKRNYYIGVPHLRICIEMCEGGI